MNPEASVLCLLAGACACVFGGLFAFLYSSYSGMARQKEQRNQKMRDIIADLKMHRAWSVSAHPQLPPPEGVQISEIGYMTLEELMELNETWSRSLQIETGGEKLKRKNRQ